MKVAKVIPIYKSSDPSLLNNYRPVSLFTAFSKLIENFMFNKLISFLNSNNTLFKHQYGFLMVHVEWRINGFKVTCLKDLNLLN